MPKGADPRVDPAPLGDVPALVRAGAANWNAGRFWDAHESWEAAWHSLRKAGDEKAAGYLRGMILVTAALENATRGKEAGFKRQFAEGLYALKTHAEGRARVGPRDAAAWEDGLATLYADACRRREWTWWRDSGWTAPPLDHA